MMKKTFCVFSMVLVLVFFSSLSFGAGLILYEINSPLTGTASAGWAALAEDASTAFTNPAGMTRLDRSQLLVGAQPLIITSEFNPSPATTFSGTDGGNAGGVIPSLGAYYVHSFSDRLKLGFSLLSYFGLGIDYGDDWVGRYYVEKSDFLTLTLSPSVAYKVNDWLSIGVMFNVLYSKLNSESAIRNFLGGPDGQLKYSDDDFGFGGGLGLLIEPRKGTRLGVTYYSPVDVSFSDVPQLNGVGPVLGGLLSILGLDGTSVGMEFTIPQWIMASGYQQITDKLAIMGNFGWQDWSQFGNVDISLSVNPETPRRFNNQLGFKDTWHAAIGAQYRVSEAWLLSAGFAYDSSPSDESNRSPDMPFDRNFRYSAGVQYDWSKNLTLGLAYVFIDLGSASINKQGFLRGNLVGDYSPNNVNVINLNLVYRF
jgi:long-chain fatty acid transport protein